MKKLIFALLVILGLTYSSQIALGELSQNYMIIDASYKNNNVDVSYPQIRSMSDLNKQETINRIIKNDVPGDISKYDIYQKSHGKSTYELHYKVTLKSSSLLSIQYVGMRYEESTAHPTNLFFTTNIDVKKGTRLRLKDLVKIDKSFVTKVRNGKYIPWDKDLVLDGKMLKSVLNDFDDESLINSLNNADDLNGGYDTYSFLTKDSLGISLCTAHAIGDHIEFEVKYQDIESNFRKK